MSAPVRHERERHFERVVIGWSTRNLFPSLAGSLWTSWVIKGPRHRIFFSGDSGYSPAFAAIGAEHGPFDLALIKIGASDPTWSEIHMTPEEAVQVSGDVRARVMLPCALVHVQSRVSRVGRSG